MTAIVLPFPRIRHGSFVAKQASHMAQLMPATAEKYLASQLDVQRKTMLRRCIAIDLIEEELDQLEKKIRSTVKRLCSPTLEDVKR